jgi:hypothetical protein
LSEQLPIRALLDTNIRPATVTRRQMARTNEKRGKAWYSTDFLTTVKRQLRNKTQSESDAIYGALKEIAEMAKAGALHLFESDETFFEGLQVKLPELRGSEFDVFRDVKVRFVRGPLQRTYVISAEFSKEEMNERWLRTLESIEHPRFLVLKKQTGGNHLADLYHLWTAEDNALDCFITLDDKFVNAVTFPQRLKTTVKICNPMRFLQWVKEPASPRAPAS